MPTTIVPTSDDKVLKKYTLQPRSAQILELLGAQVLGAVDENDLRNIASPAVCKKYVLLLADRLSEEMAKTQLYVSDKTIPIEGHEIILYKYSESQQSLCNSFAFYITRILQLIFLCMCHVSTNPAPSYDDSAAVPGLAAPAPAPDANKFRNVSALEEYIKSKNKKLTTISDIADILFGALDAEQASAGPEDPRVFLSYTGEFKYWYDAAQNRLGFTKDGKNYYMDYMLGFSRSEKNPTNGKSEKAILMFKEGELGVKPYRWFSGDVFAQPRKSKDGEKKEGGDSLEQTYRDPIFASIAERIAKARGDADDSAKVIGKKTEAASVALTPGGVVFSNPVYAIQNAMLTSKYVDGGYVYEVGNLVAVQKLIRPWMGAFMDIAFGDIYEKLTSKDGKMFTIEKNKVKWQVVQRSAADERTTQAQDVRVKLDSLFKQIREAPTISQEALMYGMQHGTRGWTSYYFHYKEFTAMQTKMAEFATSMLFSGAAGLPALVLWQTTERGKVFKVNPALISIGAKKIEFAFGEMRKAMYNLYGKTLVGIIRVNESLQLMKDELPRAGGARPACIKTRKQRGKRTGTQRRNRRHGDRV